MSAEIEGGMREAAIGEGGNGNEMDDESESWAYERD